MVTLVTKVTARYPYKNAFKADQSFKFCINYLAPSKVKLRCNQEKVLPTSFRELSS